MSGEKKNNGNNANKQLVTIIIIGVVRVGDCEYTPGGVCDGDFGDAPVDIVRVPDTALQRIVYRQRVTCRTIKRINGTRKSIRCSGCADALLADKCRVETVLVPPRVPSGILNVRCVAVGVELEFVVHVRGRVYHTAEAALRVVHVFLPFARGVGGTQ